jgi:transposase
MAIHPNGVVDHKMIPKAFDKVSFLQALEQFVPKLPSQTKAILMDNVSFHRSYDVVNFLKSKGLVPLYIPPYSPRCNPIEEVFSLLKRNFRNLELTEQFNERIKVSIQDLNLYKDMTPYYRHTRQYVAECQTSGL